MNKVGAVIVAAGKGERLGRELPKCLIRIEDVPLVLLAVWAFERTPVVESIIIVAPEGWEDMLQRDVQKLGLERIAAVTTGGKRRQDSVRAGLRLLPVAIDRVLIHDGARPLLTQRLVQRTVDELCRHEVVTVGIPVTDTLHRKEGDILEEGPDRSNLIRAQTPQGFHRELLEHAFTKTESPELTVTDEITLIRSVLRVCAFPVEGETMNVKVTHTEDLDSYRPQLVARALECKAER